MSTRAEFFASVDRHNKIKGVTEARPPHELLKNQFEITEEEYYFIKYLRSIENAEALLMSLKKKLELRNG